MAQEQSEDNGIGGFKTSSTSERVTPAWLAEALVIVRSIGVRIEGSTLEAALHVCRKRASSYASVDFALLLITFAVAGVHDLKALYGELTGSTAKALAAVWDREKLASRAALSRFLSDVRERDVTRLGEWMLQDVLDGGLRGEAAGGLTDREGRRTLLFDDDGTYHGVQQRSLAADPERPEAVRRATSLCARGYHGGSKRADMTRTRTVLQQAHSHEWLGCWSAPGNGHPFEPLEPAAAAIVRYLYAQGLDAGQGVLRLDGLYGVVRVAALLARHGLGYLMRCKDYRLLHRRAVQDVLKQPPHATYASPDSPVRREAWQVLGLTWTSSRNPEDSVVTRLVITRRPAEGPGKPRVGVRLGDWIYELFVTDRSAAAWSIVDSLSLYFARGGFEGTLAQEDREHDLEHTVSWNPFGQQLWCLLGQWVWNRRIRMGAQLQGPCLRRTEWAPAVVPARALPPPAPPPPKAPLALPAPRPMLALPAPRVLLALPAPPLAVTSVVSVPTTPLPSPDEQPVPSAPARRRIATNTLGRGAGRFGGDDFQWATEDQLRGPDGKLLRRIGQRLERRQIRVIYAASVQDCRVCLLASRCRGRPVHTGGARTVSVVEPLPMHTPPKPPAPSPSRPSHTAPPTSPAPIPIPTATPPPRTPPMPALGSGPVLWLDVDAAGLRRLLRETLHGQRVDVTTIPCEPTPTERPYTRDPRAHRRQTWAERLAHNRRPPDTLTQLLVHGVPQALHHFLGPQGQRNQVAA